jgi:hypothetical protein
VNGELFEASDRIDKLEQILATISIGQQLCRQEISEVPRFGSALDHVQYFG